MKQILIILFLLFHSFFFLQAQHIGIKTNLIADATTNMNLAIEVGIARKWTLDLPVTLNPWNLSGNKKFKFLLVQPEIRYWTCQRFNGHFWGFHLHWAKFNVGGIDMGGIWKKLREKRYDGNLCGGGISYGYHWLLSRHWNVEASAGAGYAYIRYKQYPCKACGRQEKKGDTHYIGPTKATVSLTYLF